MTPTSGRPLRPIFPSLTAFRLVLAVALLVTVGCASSGGSSLRGTLRSAERAEAAGDAATAREYYDLALAAAPEGSWQQQEALYGAAMTRLADDVEVDRAAQMLDRLAAKRGLVDEWVAVKAVRRGRQQLAELAAERDRLGARVASCAAAGELDAEAMADLPEEGSKVEVAVLRARLQRTEAELATARSELQRTEEALRKVKETLVGGGR